MERRYTLLDAMGVRDIRSFNKKAKKERINRLPYIVIVIDEFADLMATTGKDLETTLARLAAMARAVGIHIVLATQRPSIDVITGLIKANIPSRIAFMVATSSIRASSSTPSARRSCSARATCSSPPRGSLPRPHPGRLHRRRGDGRIRWMITP